METISIPIQELLEKAPDHSVKELAALYGTDYGTIYRILCRYQVKPKSDQLVKQKLTKETLQKIFEEPRTLQEAADILEVSPNQVGTALKRHGMFKSSRKSVINKFRSHRVISVLAFMLKNPEDNNMEIGKKFSCTREYVRQIREVATKEGILK